MMDLEMHGCTRYPPLHSSNIKYMRYFLKLRIHMEQSHFHEGTEAKKLYPYVAN